MRLFRLFNRTVCILKDTDRYFLRSKKTQEEWDKRVKWLSFKTQESAQVCRSASFEYGCAVCELNTTKRVLHETMEQLGKCQEQSEERRKMYANELQKRLELADRVKKMEAGQVVHAQWVYDGPGEYHGTKEYHRSNCGLVENFNPNICEMRYCWTCGARMDGGENDV